MRPFGKKIKKDALSVLTGIVNRRISSVSDANEELRTASDLGGTQLGQVWRGDNGKLAFGMA